MLDRTGTLSFAMWRQKGERKDRTSLLPSGMKMVGNGRENPLTVTVPVFFLGREQEREWERRTGKRIRYYGISETEITDREHINYDGKISITVGNTTHVTSSNI